MRKLIAIAAAAALLAACATPPAQPNPVASSASSGLIVVGTLSLGPCEMSLAGDYTRTQVVLQKATRRLNDGRLSVAEARRIVDRGHAILAALDTVCPLEAENRRADGDKNRAFVATKLPQLEAMIPGGTK